MIKEIKDFGGDDFSSRIGWNYLMHSDNIFTTRFYFYNDHEYLMNINGISISIKSYY